MVCICDFDADQQPEFIRYSEVRARKEYKCCECGSPIHAGATYEYVVGKWEGDFDSFKTCIPCAAIRTDFCGSFGELRNDIWECLGLDYITGKTVDDDPAAIGVWMDTQGMQATRT